MRYLHKKLNSRRGETLVEVLAAILLCTISVALLVSGVMASVQINRKARQSDRGFYEALSAAEQKNGTPVGSGSVLVRASGITDVIFDVEFYGDDSLYSYGTGGGEPHG